MGTRVSSRLLSFSAASEGLVIECSPFLEVSLCLNNLYTAIEDYVYNHAKSPLFRRAETRGASCAIRGIQVQGSVVHKSTSQKN
jgi:hypothetical protein